MHLDVAYAQMTLYLSGCQQCLASLKEVQTLLTHEHARGLQGDRIPRASTKQRRERLPHHSGCVAPLQAAGTLCLGATSQGTDDCCLYAAACVSKKRQALKNTDGDA